MLLAELEIWHSRPITPTRRVALGHLVLPADPAPGFGGVLLGAVVVALNWIVVPPNFRRTVFVLPLAAKSPQARIRKPRPLSPRTFAGRV